MINLENIVFFNGEKMNKSEYFDKITCIKLFREMKRIRLIEDAIADNYYNTTREMHTPIHLCNGQEAIAVGVCQQLEKEDVIFSNHRCHGHYLAKGGDLKKMIAELFSKETGCCKGKGGSMHLTDRNAGVAVSSAIVAGNVPIGTGYALAFKQQKKKNIVVVFLGDGASEEGSVYESICFAKIHKLPVIFICENNLYAISTGYKIREPQQTVSDKFKTIIETKVIDGNDVLLVSETIREYVDKVRNGEGPVFVEGMTYRLRDHHNIGDGIESGYRTQKEWDDWNRKSPIVRMENFLKEKAWITQEHIEEIEQQIGNEIEEAFIYARNSKLPEKESLYSNLWGE